MSHLQLFIFLLVLIFSIHLLSDPHPSLPIGFPKSFDKARRCASILVVDLQHEWPGSVADVKYWAGSVISHFVKLIHLVQHLLQSWRKVLQASDMRCHISTESTSAELVQRQKSWASILLACSAQ